MSQLKQEALEELSKDPNKREGEKEKVIWDLKEEVKYSRQKSRLVKTIISPW